MIEEVEPISKVKKRKNFLPFVVPYIPSPQIWAGPIIVHELYKNIFNSATRVIKATLDNDYLTRKKKYEMEQLRGKKEFFQRLQFSKQSKNFFRSSVVRIH